MEEILRSRLQSQVQAAVDWGLSAQGATSPRIVLFRVGGGGDYTTTGPSGLRRARVQADCYGSGVGPAKLLARAVIAALSGWRAGSILGVFLEAERDLTPDTGLANTEGRVSLDFIVHYQE